MKIRVLIFIIIMAVSSIGQANPVDDVKKFHKNLDYGWDYALYKGIPIDLWPAYFLRNLYRYAPIPGSDWTYPGDRKREPIGLLVCDWGWINAREPRMGTSKRYKTS